jgi:endonuclease-3
MNKNSVNQIFERLSAQDPSPKTELNFVNHYTLLVAVVLSAQSTDKGVNKATEALFAKVDTPQKMLQLGESGLKKYIKTIGLYNTKAKNIILLSEKLITEHGGVVPKTREALEALAGVGRKTANVVLNCAFGEHTMAVDTHVQRVSNRIGLAKAKTPLETEKQLMKRIPDMWMEHAHHWLILHGRYTCKAQKPQCERCIINDLCEYKGKPI